MISQTRLYSVYEVAAMCGVGRSTVTYWIRNRGLNATRKGKGYRVSDSDLQAFLPAKGRDLPAGIATSQQDPPVFKPLNPCWQYWQGIENGHRCQACIVLAHRLSPCFIARKSNRLQCQDACPECRHYLDNYRPRFSFIYQLDFPAGVYQDLHFWGANRALEHLFGVDALASVGMGLEQVIHSESLSDIITHNRKQQVGEPVPAAFPITFKTNAGEKVNATVSIYPLCRGENTFLIIGA